MNNTTLQLCQWGCFNTALPVVEQWWRNGLTRESYSQSFPYCLECRETYVEMCDDCEENSGEYTDFSKNHEYVEWKEKQNALFYLLDPYLIPDINRMVLDYL